MKISIFSLLLLFLHLSPMYAGEQSNTGRVSERVYISTDRAAYVAGETMWMSAFCIDANNGGKLSSLSNVLYVEIHNSISLVTTAKIALLSGRGSGHIQLPPSLPTGNYKIFAYTHQMLNEQDVPIFEKIIPVYNTITTDRVNGNVVVSEESVPVPSVQLSRDADVRIRFGNSGRLINAGNSFDFDVVNSSKEKIFYSLSVFKEDSLFNIHETTVVDAFSTIDNNGTLFIDRYIPEYEGEIIKGRVISENNSSLWDKIIYFSVCGGESDIYSSVLDSMGNFTFYTSHFFGDREVVIEVPSADTTISLDYLVEDPFQRLSPGDVPQLILPKNLSTSLVERSIAMQTGRRFNADTLIELRPYKADPLLQRNPVVYKLDDYTRFPVMQEVVIEYIPELRFRNVGGKTDLQVRVEDSFRNLTFSRDNSLVLLDGIPVFSHSKIHSYDPLRVEYIHVYTSEHQIGAASFVGLVSFKTYNNDYPGLSFSRNVRIMDYQGVLYPSAMTASKVRDLNNFPDMRSMLYWHPTLELEPGKEDYIEVFSSAVPGRYIIKIEGISESGVPLLYYTGIVISL